MWVPVRLLTDRYTIQCQDYGHFLFSCLFAFAVVLAVIVVGFVVAFSKSQIQILSFYHSPKSAILFLSNCGLFPFLHLSSVSVSCKK